jgi:hypothetical protein
MPHLLEVTKAANERSADVLLRELLGDRLITIDIVVPEVRLHVLACADPVQDLPADDPRCMGPLHELANTIDLNAPAAALREKVSDIGL